MNYKIVFLQQAVFDLKELKNYVTKNFSKKIWEISYQKIKKTVRNLKNFPTAGGTLPELEKINLTQYRQAISGMNRIIYEVREKVIYIHIICDARRDMRSLLTKRLFRSEYHQ